METLVEVWRKDGAARIFTVTRSGEGVDTGFIVEFNLKATLDWFWSYGPGAWLQQESNADWRRETEGNWREAYQAFKLRATKAGFVRYYAGKAV